MYGFCILSGLVCLGFVFCGVCLYSVCVLYFIEFDLIGDTNFSVCIGFVFYVVCIYVLIYLVVIGLPDDASQKWTQFVSNSLAELNKQNSTELVGFSLFLCPYALFLTVSLYFISIISIPTIFS